LSDSPYYKEKKYLGGVYSIDDPYLYVHFNKNGKGTNLDFLTRKKKPLNITLYGNNLHLVCFINGLINRGVKPNRINIVLPPKTFSPKTEFKSNVERLQYEDGLINDPDIFED